VRIGRDPSLDTLRRLLEMGEEIREFACCLTVVSAAAIWLSERYAGAGQRLDQAEMNGSEPSLWSSWFPVGLIHAMSEVVWVFWTGPIVNL
jgi:hypothetical protein